MRSPCVSAERHGPFFKNTLRTEKGLEHMEERTCIYCLQAKGNKGFMNTEHVLPQAFGLFKSNLTLNGTV
jgi:hypothetical protein